MINKSMQEAGLNRSAIRELFEYGRTLAQRVGSQNVFDFTLGNPASPCPSEVTEAAIDILCNEPLAAHSYTPAQGDIAARRAVCDVTRERHGFDLDPELVYMTCGAAAALAITFRALSSGNGESFVVCAPYFPEYDVFVKNAGATLKVVKTTDTFDLDIDALAAAIDSGVWGVIINSPNNPSGAVYNNKKIAALSAMLEQKKAALGHPIYMIIDEPYREILFDVQCPYIPAYYDDCIVCYSYSKSMSLPGERIGYVAVSPRAADAQLLYAAIAGAARHMGYVCAPSLFQKVIARCAGSLSDQTLYRDNRDILVPALTKMGYSVVNPNGAFYVMVRSPLGSGQAFSDKAKQLGLLLVPSESFGVDGYVRIATCVSKDTVVRSLPVFERVISR